jgi:hypothetical protein
MQNITFIILHPHASTGIKPWYKCEILDMTEELIQLFDNINQTSP